MHADGPQCNSSNDSRLAIVAISAAIITSHGDRRRRAAVLPAAATVRPSEAQPSAAAQLERQWQR
jgi:hypothetical protein